MGKPPAPEPFTTEDVAALARCVTDAEQWCSMYRENDVGARAAARVRAMIPRIRALVPTLQPTGRVLERLTKVVKTRAGHWTARCPVHEDHAGDALSIHEARDARVILRCDAGCTVGSILTALDLRMTDLFPERV